MVKSKKIRLLMESSSTLSSSVNSESLKSPKQIRRVSKPKCKICGATFAYLDDLKWHKDTMHVVTNDDNGNVRKSLRIKVRAKRKYDSENVEAVEFDERDLGFSEKPGVKNDESINKTKSKLTNEIICDHCGYKCKKKNTLIKHIATYHPNEEVNLDADLNPSVISCAICLKTFASKGNLRKHVQIHELPNDAGDKTVKSNPKLKKGYCCDICHQGFHNQRDMLAHRDVIHDTAASLDWTCFCRSHAKLKYCRQCCKYFNDNELFSHHKCVKGESEQITERIQALLESTPSYKCDICSLCFHWKYLLRYHCENVHHIAKPIDQEIPITAIQFYCKSCFKAFDGDDDLKKHRIKCVVNPENKLAGFPCGLCGKSFTRKSDFRRHVRTKHPDPEQTDFDNVLSRKKPDINCPYCGLSMTNRNNMLKHIKDTHNIEMDSPFACLSCNKVFKRKATLDTHNQIYHPKEENSEEINKIIKEAEFLLNGEIAYHCNKCKRNLPSLTKFLAHYRLHNLERKFTCDLCGKQTRTQHQLNIHVKIIHLNIRNFECDICHKTFHSKQSCEEHRRIHTGERPFSCEICGKTFIALNALFTHKKFHNDFYAHPCTMCPKKFKIRRSLINHIRTHTGERPYKCDLCQKTFNNSSRFSYHKKVTHSNDRPFTCDQCGSCFKANKFLMRHMKLHSIQTHVQLRRRNNPAYFETHDKNPKKPSAWTSQSKNTNPSTKVEPELVGEAANGTVSSATFSITKITLNGIEDVKLENGLESKFVDEAFGSSMRNHFLADAFTVNSNPNEFVESTNDPKHEIKHNVCL